MKVAFIAFDWGEYSIRLTSALARDAEVCLLLAEHQAKHHQHRLSPKVQMHTFKKPRIRQLYQQWQVIQRLRCIIDEFNPDVVHMQHGHFWFNFALPWLRRYPLVLTIHDPRIHLGDKFTQNTPQWIFDFGFRRAHQIIVHTNQASQVMQDELQIPRDIMHVIPHILIGDDSEQADVAEEENTILFFGRIWAYKGLEYLIRAEPLITSRVPNAKIVIGGRGDDFAHYRELMINPENFIVHNEYVSNAKRAELFRRASVIALPYIEATQSGVVPIAYTFGKPVVATNVGGLPEQIDHAQTGFLIPPRDEVALANTIVTLLQDKELRRRIGANGKRKLENEWSAEAIAQKTLPVYAQAIGDHPVRHVQRVGASLSMDK